MLTLDAAAAAAGRPPAALLILDPPWENRSARRAHAYDVMTRRQISEIRISDWCAFHWHFWARRSRRPCPGSCCRLMRAR